MAPTALVLAVLASVLVGCRTGDLMGKDARKAVSVAEARAGDDPVAAARELTDLASRDLWTDLVTHGSPQLVSLLEAADRPDASGRRVLTTRAVLALVGPLGAENVPPAATAAALGPLLWRPLADPSVEPGRLEQAMAALTGTRPGRSGLRVAWWRAVTATVIRALDEARAGSLRPAIVGSAQLGARLTAIGQVVRAADRAGGIRVAGSGAAGAALRPTDQIRSVLLADLGQWVGSFPAGGPVVDGLARRGMGADADGSPRDFPTSAATVTRSVLALAVASEPALAVDGSVAAVKARLLAGLRLGGLGGLYDLLSSSSFRSDALTAPVAAWIDAAASEVTAFPGW